MSLRMRLAPHPPLKCHFDGGRTVGPGPGPRAGPWPGLGGLPPPRTPGETPSKTDIKIRKSNILRPDSESPPKNDSEKLIFNPIGAILANQ